MRVAISNMKDKAIEALRKYVNKNSNFSGELPNKYTRIVDMKPRLQRDLDKKSDNHTFRKNNKTKIRHR